MNIQDQTRFNSLCQRYLNELTLQGKSPKTINMYSRCLRQVGVEDRANHRKNINERKTKTDIYGRPYGVKAQASNALSLLSFQAFASNLNTN